MMATYGPDHDAIEAMTEIVDGFKTYVSGAENQRRKARKYRLNLLWIHSIAALLMAPAFASIGQEGMQAGNWAYLRHIAYAPYSIALVLGFGGLLLGIGVLLRARAVEVVGLVFLSAFYLIIAVGFGLANILYLRGGLAGPKPALYAPILYLHLTVIMAIHGASIIRRVALRQEDK